MGAEPTPETLWVSNIPHTMYNVQNGVPIINQPLSQTFRESIKYLIGEPSSSTGETSQHPTDASTLSHMQKHYYKCYRVQ
jgi:hypothetical protein